VPSLFDCFRKALLKRGKVGQLYTDNGPCYRSKALSSTCAVLGVELIHAEDYSPEGKGKIERHIGTVKSGFYQEAQNSGLQSLEDLNAFFFAWLEKEYHNTKHSTLGMTPFERWQIDEEKGFVEIVRPEKVRHALMLREDRKVGKRTALIQLNNRMYQASRELAGKKVEVLWEADRLNPTIEVWLNGKLVETAKEVTPGSNIDFSKRPARQRQPQKPRVLHSSKQFRLTLVSEHNPNPAPSFRGDYLSEPEFQKLMATVLERELTEEERLYLSGVFAELSPLRDLPTESTLRKAAGVKGTNMHLRYYCDLLSQARLS
jgi:hypothetical protein